MCHTNSSICDTNQAWAPWLTHVCHDLFICDITQHMCHDSFISATTHSRVPWLRPSHLYISIHSKRSPNLSKETCKRNLQKRPIYHCDVCPKRPAIVKRDLHALEQTNKRSLDPSKNDLQKRSTKETYKTDLQKRPTSIKRDTLTVKKCQKRPKSTKRDLNSRDL